ncbi:MAG: hypothetical protein WD063_12955 [Pirellulales bacterium]
MSAWKLTRRYVSGMLGTILAVVALGCSQQAPQNPTPAGPTYPETLAVYTAEQGELNRLMGQRRRLLDQDDLSKEKAELRLETLEQRKELWGLQRARGDPAATTEALAKMAMDAEEMLVDRRHEHAQHLVELKELDKQIAEQEGRVKRAEAAKLAAEKALPPTK